MSLTDTRSPDTSVRIFATFTPKSGSETAVLSVLREVLTPTRAEPGCLRFDLFEGQENPPTYHLYEIFVNAGAIDFHRCTDHYRQYRKAIDPLLAVPPRAIRVSPLDVAPA